jgi:hypothetical protein
MYEIVEDFVGISIRTYVYNDGTVLNKSSARPQPGDLVLVNSANKGINAYTVSPDFSFANVAFVAINGEMGIVLDNASSENGSILYHYVRVLFERGMVGIVHGGLVKVITLYDESVEIAV